MYRIKKCDTQVLTEIKRKFKHQDTQGYYWRVVVWGGVITAKRELLYSPELFRLEIMLSSLFACSELRFFNILHCSKAESLSLKRR